MAILRAMHILQMDSGTPADAVVNTFHFKTPLPVASAADLDQVVAAVAEFFDVNTITGLPVMGLLSEHVSPSLATIKVYDLGDPKPRLAKRTNVRTAALTSGGSHPHEVALVGSYRSQPESGVPQARRRGRVYIGPLSNQADLISTTTNDVRPAVKARQTLALACSRMISETPTIWTTFSTVDGQAVAVVDGFVDNAYDTQRRRGTRATDRTKYNFGGLI